MNALPIVACVLACASLGRAQIPTSRPMPEQDPMQQEAQRAHDAWREGRSPSYPWGTGIPGLKPFYPQGQPFPPLDPATGRYGSYPNPLGNLPRSPLAPRPEPKNELWPSWIEVSPQDRSLKKMVSRALLARTSDRVWVLDPGETAQVPLAFWQKFHVVQKGSAVEVRHQRGEFEIAMHDGASLRSRGIVSLRFDKLEDEAIGIVLESFSELWWTGSERPMHAELPGGARIETSGARVRLSSDGALGTLTNFGPGTVRFRGVGQVEVLPLMQMRWLLAKKEAAPMAAELVLEGALAPERRGRVLQVVGQAGGGSVSWSGARIELEPGSTLRLDPLAGREFPENKAKPK